MSEYAKLVKKPITILINTSKIIGRREDYQP
jgi:hypothetical protein